MLPKKLSLLNTLLGKPSTMKGLAFLFNSLCWHLFIGSVRVSSSGSATWALCGATYQSLTHSTDNFNQETNFKVYLMLYWERLSSHGIRVPRIQAKVSFLALLFTCARFFIFQSLCDRHYKLKESKRLISWGYFED